jgi:integrase
MSVRVRARKRGSWMVDVSTRLTDGTRYRERRCLRISAKSAAHRWGEERERHLLQYGLPKPKKEVIPTLAEFWPRFLDGHARAEKQKPSGIAAKEMIGRVHLLPVLGDRRLDKISPEVVQSVKTALRDRAAKTINNVLSVLNTALKKAVAWGVIERMPCSVGLLKVSMGGTQFHDFAEYGRLVEEAEKIDATTKLITLLGGDAGLRCGEMIALEWADVDLVKRQLCVRRSDWNGQVTAPKGGRLRYVPLTVGLTAALRHCRHLRSPRVLCHDDGKALTRQQVQYRVKRAARRANVPQGVHVLRHTFCSHLSMRGAPARAIQELAGHSELGTTQRYMHLSPAALDAAIQLLDGRGNIVATGERSGAEVGKV